MILASTFPLGGLSARPCIWGDYQKKDPTRRLLNEKPWVGVPRGMAATPTCNARCLAVAAQGCCCCSWATFQERREENNLAPLRQLTKAGPGRAFLPHARRRAAWTERSQPAPSVGTAARRPGVAWVPAARRPPPRRPGRALPRRPSSVRA